MYAYIIMWIQKKYQEWVCKSIGVCDYQDEI